MAIIVLSVMMAMALVGLGYFLWPTSVRQANDAKLPTPTPRELRKPTELAGLGYLPERCNLVAGIQLIEIEDDPQARKLLAKPRPLYLGLVFAYLESVTGLKMEDLDHVVLGANTDFKAPVTLVLATRKRYDLAELAKLHGDKIGDHQGKPVFAFQPLAGRKGNGPMALLAGIEGRVWCPEPQILVLAIRWNDSRPADSKMTPILENDLPFSSRPAGEVLSEEIKDVLTKRIDQHSLAWVGGHLEESAHFLLGLLGTKLPQGAKDLNEFKRVKTFGLSLRSEGNGFVLNGQVSGTDEADTRALVKFLQKLGANEPGLIIAEPPLDVHGPDAGWIGVQQNYTLEQVRKNLGGLGGNDKQ